MGFFLLLSMSFLKKPQALVGKTDKNLRVQLGADEGDFYPRQLFFSKSLAYDQYWSMWAFKMHVFSIFGKILGQCP